MSIWKKVRLMSRLFLIRSFSSSILAILSNSKITWLKNFLIKRFIKKYKIDLSRLENADIKSYPNFNSFFIRKIKQNVMGKSADSEIGSPAEALVREHGMVNNNTMLQAKGIKYSLSDLLFYQKYYVDKFKNGSYLTLHLRPFHYHRYHMPFSGKLELSLYIPHYNAFELDPDTESIVPNLYCNNERYILFFDTALGKMAIVLVGSIYIGGIQPVWRSKPIKSKKIKRDIHKNIALKKGEELGCFKYGSGIILLFEPDSISWKKELRKGKEIMVNSAIADLIK
ncbi:MAG TPA: archaetidylserine decarboxylase [Gammaproteobacteria bacterium]|nr:archaetidylserine decarboxylase [Gammaproteobacteria bacterium]